MGHRPVAVVSRGATAPAHQDARTMPIITHVDQETITIAVSGRFDGDLGNAFTHAYQSHSDIHHYQVDFSRVGSIDSSGIGLLLMLREHANKNRGRLEIINCTETMKTIFRAAKLDRLFAIN